MKVNYYEVLGVERSASEQEIRDRFRRLAREQHPDRYKGPDKAEAERRFQLLTEAVNILTNSAKRKQHDAELSSGINKSSADFAQVAKAYLAKILQGLAKKGVVRTQRAVCGGHGCLTTWDAGFDGSTPRDTSGTMALSGAKSLMDRGDTDHLADGPVSGWAQVAAALEKASTPEAMAATHRMPFVAIPMDVPGEFLLYANKE